MTGFHTRTIHRHPILVVQHTNSVDTCWWSWRLYNPQGVWLKAGTAHTVDQCFHDAEQAIVEHQAAA